MEGHSKQECPKLGSINHSTVQISCYKCKKWVAKGGVRSCPACGHASLEGNPIGHCLEHCAKYEVMTANQSSDCVKSANWCPVHLSSTHDLNTCTQKNDLRLVCGINGCTKHHHRSLHGSTTPFIAQINSLTVGNYEHLNTKVNDISTTFYNSDNVLLSMQMVSTPSGNVNCFFDDGSTCCLVLNSTAKRLGLKGKDVIMTLSTVNVESELRTKLFFLDLVDIDNIKHTIKAFEVQKITGVIKSI